MEKKEFNYKKLLLQIMMVFIYIICFPTIIIPLLVTIFIYESAFGVRADKPSHVIDINDYPELEEEKIEFFNGHHILRGGIFKYKSIEKPKAGIIVSHGIGCNMNLYLNRIDYFAKKGYLVLSLDLSGTDKSDGKGLIGIPESQIDIGAAVKYAKDRYEFRNLKLFVYGHSWSGYGCAAMLNDDEVCRRIDGVASMSGFNDAWQSVAFQGKEYVGNVICLAYPWLMLYQIIRFGKRAIKTGIDGINNFDKPVLVTQSKDDPTVPMYLSIYGNKDKCTNEQATFRLYEDRGHTTSRPVEVEKKICKDCEGKVYDHPMDTNLFEHFVNKHYAWSSVKDIQAIDEEFMDDIDKYFTELI